jgi:hypothetical protein
VGWRSGTGIVWLIASSDRRRRHRYLDGHLPSSSGSLAMFAAISANILRHARDGRAAIGASSGQEPKARMGLSENPHWV